LAFLSLQIGLALFYLAGFAFSLLAAASLFGDQSTVIKIENVWFRKTTRLGLLHWTRQYSVRDVKGIRISELAPPANRRNPNLQDNPSGVLYLLMGDTAVKVADHRPLPVIRELGAALATAVNNAKKGLPDATAEDAEVLPLLDCSNTETLDADSPETPADARICIARRLDSLWISIPPPPRSLSK
jgi:hypothetical protein